ncbi:MAG: RDD family protein [Pseudomonadota bacterium]
MEQPNLKKDTAPDIQSALSQAEQDHWLERPNAPLALRLASFVLDVIFIYLFFHGLHRLIQALSLHLSSWGPNEFFFLNPFVLGFLDVFLRTCFLFFYLIASVSLFGGTIGQILLGLRIVDEKSGKLLDLTHSTIRLFYGAATNLLSLAVAVSRPDGKTLHDLLSKTAIKKVRGRT